MCNGTTQRIADCRFSIDDWKKRNGLPLLFQSSIVTLQSAIPLQDRARNEGIVGAAAPRVGGRRDGGDPGRSCRPRAGFGRTGRQGSGRGAKSDGPGGNAQQRRSLSGVAEPQSVATGPPEGVLGEARLPRHERQGRIERRRTGIAGVRGARHQEVHHYLRERIGRGAPPGLQETARQRSGDRRRPLAYRQFDQPLQLSASGRGRGAARQPPLLRGGGDADAERQVSIPRQAVDRLAGFRGGQDRRRARRQPFMVD